MIEGEMRGAKSGGGVTLLRRISTETVARSLNSGELLRQPGGTIWRGTKGEMERRQGATYTHSERSKRAGIKAGLKRGRNYCAVETVSGVVNARKTKLRPDVRARAVSEGEGRKGGTGSGGLAGPRAESWTGPVRFPLTFLFIFLLSSFSFFCFLISFLDFA
jgi:hypothetical protein